MADQPLTLDHARTRLGEQVLEHADRIGLAATGAAWIRDASTDGWILELATPMLDSHGPAWLYQRLATIFSKMPLPQGITMLEFRLASPDEALWRLLASVFHVDRSSVTLSGNVVNGMMLPDMLLYRALPSTKSAAQQAETLDQRYRALVNA